MTRRCLDMFRSQGDPKAINGLRFGMFHTFFDGLCRLMWIDQNLARHDRVSIYRLYQLEGSSTAPCKETDVIPLYDYYYFLEIEDGFAEYIASLKHMLGLFMQLSDLIGKIFINWMTHRIYSDETQNFALQTKYSWV